MVSFTNQKASMVSGEMEFPYNCSMYLLIRNLFSGALLPSNNDGAILKSDGIRSGNFGWWSSPKIVVSRETISYGYEALI